MGLLTRKAGQLASGMGAYLLGFSDAYGSTPDFIRTIGGEGNRFRPIAWRDIERLITKYTWRQLLNRGRYIYANSGLVSGAVAEKANYVIGDNWRAAYVGPDKDWGEKAEDVINEWRLIADTRGQPYDFLQDLWLGCVAMERDGDFFVLLNEGANGFPQIQVVPAHRIGQRELPNIAYVVKGRYEGNLIINGTIYNNDMRPVAFRYMGDNYQDDIDISSNNIVQFFDPMWHGQGRGIPNLTSSLADFDDIFEVREAEKMAAEINGSITILEYNQTGRIDDSADWIIDGQQTNPDGTKERKLFYELRDKGQTRYFKAGSGQKLEAFKPDRPGATFVPFADHILRGAFMGMQVPIEWCYAPEKLGGPAGRIVTGRFKRAVRHRQKLIYPGARRILLWAIAKHMKLGLLPESDNWYQWKLQMPPEASIDSNYDAANERANFLIGFDNLDSIYGRQGRNWKEGIDQKINEMVYVKEQAEKNGLDFGQVIQLTPNMATSSETTPDGGGGGGSPGEPKEPSEPKEAKETSE